MRLLKYLLLFLCIAALPFIINIIIIRSSETHIFRDITAVPPKTAIVVLGSRVHGTQLSHVLEDRVKAGIDLVKAEKSQKILLSGDHGRKGYDEVNAMRLFILEFSDINEEDIFMDHAGFNTYDSMYRARDIFEVQDMIIVTQEFHINRAVYIARRMGIDAVGYAVDQSRFSRRTVAYWNMREFFSRNKAFVSLLLRLKPHHLGETIPITGDGRTSWD